MPAYRLAIFDFDGTLADSAEWGFGVMNDMARRHGYRVIDDAEREHLRGRPNHEIIQALGVPLWKLPFIVADFRRLAAENAAKIPLFPSLRLIWTACAVPASSSPSPVPTADRPSSAFSGRRPNSSSTLPAAPRCSARRRSFTASCAVTGSPRNRRLPSATRSVTSPPPARPDRQHRRVMGLVPPRGAGGGTSHGDRRCARRTGAPDSRRPGGGSALVGGRGRWAAPGRGSLVTDRALSAGRPSAPAPAGARSSEGRGGASATCGSESSITGGWLILPPISRTISGASAKVP